MSSNVINGYREILDDYLKAVLASPFGEVDGIYDAMYYSVKNGGKRVRPVLTMLFCKASGGNPENALPLAAAVELIHTYSLIHDDLPCMDNDDFRRGKPSNHKVFGEANAVLAGDALLTAAFSLIADGAKKGLYSFEAAVKAVDVLSSLSGASGMVGGQFIDLSSEGKEVSVETLELQDKLKTGALISAACVLGCIAANADEKLIKSAENFAYSTGLAFQIKDDVLDVTGSLEKIGKKTGSDSENNKATYVGLLGLEKCRALVDELTEIALSSLDAFPETEELVSFSEYLSSRES